MDASIFKFDKLILVEFKNQSNKKLNHQEIRLKVLESIDFLRAEYNLSNEECQLIEVILVNVPSEEEKVRNKARIHYQKLTNKNEEYKQLECLKFRYGILTYKFDNKIFKEYLEIS